MSSKKCGNCSRMEETVAELRGQLDAIQAGPSTASNDLNDRVAQQLQEKDREIERLNVIIAKLKDEVAALQNAAVDAVAVAEVAAVVPVVAIAAADVAVDVAVDVVADAATANDDEVASADEDEISIAAPDFAVEDFLQLLEAMKQQKMVDFNRWQRRLFRLAMAKIGETVEKPIVSIFDLPKQYVVINDCAITRDGHMFAGGYRFQTDRVNSMGFLEEEGEEKEPIVQQKWIGKCDKCSAKRQITTYFFLNIGELYFSKLRGGELAHRCRRN